MDLTSVEATAAHAKNAVVIFGIGAIIVSFRIWHFARTDQVEASHGARLAAACIGVFALVALIFVHIYTEELTELLKAEIASAGARAAEANRRTAVLENANLELRSHVGTLEKSNLAASKEVASLQIEVAHAKRRQAEAETQLAKVTKRLQPRHFGLDRERLVTQLRTSAPYKAMLIFSESSPESEIFALSLYAVLQNAGWRPLYARKVASTSEYGATLGDLFFLVRNLADLSSKNSESIHALTEALREQGYLVGDANSDSKLPDDLLWIILQPKS